MRHEKKMYMRKGIITFAVMMMVLLLQGTVAFAANSAKLSNDGTEVMPVEHYPVTLNRTVGTTTRTHLGSYDEALRNVYTFLDAQNQLNVASFSGSELTVQVYDSSFQVKKTISITPRYAKFGGIICDANGNYYVVWAQYDENQTNCVTMCIAKYNSSGTFLKELLLKGEDTPASGLSDSGTRYPFQFGNTSLAIQKGTLAVHYARVMYNGHQSNMIIYVDCATMARKTGATCYISHSFDQRAYATAEGNNFLFLNQGDAYYRGFKISQVNASTLSSAGEFYNFHFREGTVRYQEIFSQMGGIAEVNAGYVFLGASERALDHVDNSSAGNSGKAIDARELFLQVLKKDFKNYSGANKFVLAGETRAGKASTLSSAPHYFVSSDVDYGVNWLTNYDANYYASNPKVVAIGNEQFAIMWEKRSYSSNDVKTYYAVMDVNGNVIKDTMILQDCLLAADTDPVFLNGRIYWTTKDSYGFRINVLNVNGQSIAYHDHEFEEASRDGNNVTLRCKICGTTREIVTTSKISFYLSVNNGGYRWSSTYESSGGGLSVNVGDQVSTWINVDTDSTDDLEISIADGRLATFVDGTTKTTAKDPTIVAKAGGKVAVTIRPKYVSNPVKKTFYLNITGAPPVSNLSGVVTIQGKLVCGQTLTAQVSETNNTGILSYQWKRGDSNISGANSAEYTLGKDDVGKIISCVVTSSVELNSISGTTTDIVADAVDTSAPSLMGLNVSNGIVTVSWKANTGVPNYAVFRKTDSGSWTRLAIVSGTSYSDATAAVGHSYTYTVRGMNENDKYVTSYNTNGLKVTLGEALDKSSPVLLGANAGEDSITVTWKANSGVDKYAIFRKTGSGKWTKVAVTTGTANGGKARAGFSCMWVDRAAEAGVTYGYTVRGMDAGDKYVTSYDTNGVSAKIQKEAIDKTSPILTGATAVENGITVTWIANSGVYKYAIFRKTGNGKWAKVAETTGTAAGNKANAGSSCSWVDMTAQAGVTYGYTVRGMDASDKYVTSYDVNGVSAMIQKETLDKSSPILTGVTGDANGVTVTWIANSGVDKYTVFRKTAGGTWTKVGETTGTASGSKASAGSTCSWVDTAVSASTSYVYTVRGMNANGAYVTSYHSDGVSITIN